MSAHLRRCFVRSGNSGWIDVSYTATTEELEQSHLADNEGDPRKKNSQQLISRLSDDILCAIFQLNAVAIPQTPIWATTSQIDFLESQETTRYTSQVCHHWRLVSIQCPLLWDSIVFGRWWSPQWSIELLRRCALAPIDILSFGELAKSLQDEAIGPRVRSFHAVYSDIITWEVLSAWLEHPKCQLKNISFSHASNSERTYIHDLPFSTLSSSVKNLFLSNYHINLQTSAFRNISNLTLTYFGGRDNVHIVRYTPLQLLSFLANMPQIVTVSLSNALTASFSTATSLPLVFLPHLQALELDDEYSPSSAVLVHLSLPPSCSLGLNLANLQLDSTFNIIVGLISSRIINDAKHDGASLKIDLWSPLIARLESKRETKLNFFKIYNRNASADSLLSFIEPLLASIRSTFSSFRSFTLGLNHFHLSFIPYLGEFRKVQSLQVETIASTTLRHVLQTSLPFSADRDPTMIVFPSLRTISIDGARLLFNDQLTLGMFVDFLQWRITIGSKIEIVQIRYEDDEDINKSVTPTDIRALEEEGVRVDVFLDDVKLSASEQANFDN